MIVEKSHVQQVTEHFTHAEQYVFVLRLFAVKIPSVHATDRSRSTVRLALPHAESEWSVDDGSPIASRRSGPVFAWGAFVRASCSAAQEAAGAKPAWSAVASI